MNSTIAPNLAKHEPGTDPGPASRPHRRIGLGVERFAGVYVWALIIVVFSLWVPNLFLTTVTFRVMIAQQAITLILALGLMVPVAAGAFDLSIAGTLSVSSAIAVWFQTNHHGWIPGIIAALLVGAVIGLINGFLVVKCGVDSFISTLGMSSVLSAGSYWVLNSQQVVKGIDPQFVAFGQHQILGLPLAVYYAIAVGIVLFVVLQYRPIGRSIYATGGNQQAARLAGVRTGRIVTGSLVTSGVLAALAGVLLASQVANATPDAGAPFLLPAFSAVFLGATQIVPGRMNVLGTVLAILLLATGVTGLQLAGAQAYITQLFDGVALILAVALAVRSVKRART